jgi:Zn-dependent protease with chaperone function
VSSPIDVMVYRAVGPATGCRGQARVVGDRLQVDAAGVIEEVRCADCTAAVGGFEHDQLQLQWDDAISGARHALLPADAAAQQALLDGLNALPANTVPTLAQWRQRTRRQRRVLQGVLVGLGVLALSVVLLVWQHDRVLDWITWQIPREVETRLGASIAEQIERDRRVLDDGAAVAAMQTIGARLVAGSAYSYRWLVVDDDSVNAFALPGGIIVVHRGLIERAASADELAAVLAHEAQHVEQRHSLRHLVNQTGLAAAMLVVLGDVNAVVLLIAHQAGAQYFSRSMETEADLVGVRQLHERKFLTRPMLTMFEKLKNADARRGGAKKPERAEPREGAGALDWLSSHPQVDERIHAIRAFVEANPCADCGALAIDWPAVQQGLATQIAAGRRTER